MAYMKRMLWFLLALAEIVVAFVLAGPWLIVVLKIAITALFHKEVFQPNAAYFMGMLLGCLIRIAPAAILGYHAVWIARKRIIQASALVQVRSSALVQVRSSALVQVRSSALVQVRSIARAPLLFAGWVALGILVAFTFVLLLGVLILPHSSLSAPGDGIMLLLLLMIFVPVGAILGCVYAAMALKTKT